MPLALTLLDGVRWHGEPVLGDRQQALLAALAEAGGRVVAVDALVNAIWADDEPASPRNALQVLVSRVRSACGADAVERVGEGYRLGVPAGAVDVLVVADRLRAARLAFETDPAESARLAAEALALGLAVPVSDEPGPIADLRRTARTQLAEANRLQARAVSRMGRHAEALPALEQAHGDDPTDEALLADLLRSEAAARGAAAAIDRYGAYRAGLRDRLGTDPGPALQRVHAELLASDSPVREGVHFDATDLLGRDSDIRSVHALLATSRVVTVLGPGGLGKTRLAHVLGRQATQPVVHFVELVSVTVAEDLIGEVGSSLGVRDSVSGRRTLTPEQRADVRARIAQHLDQAPSLLILDNCEHIVAAVADLVAYLVATTQTVRVLTTSRSPLAISAETVYPLSELSTADGAELFRRRATAARPDVHLEDGPVVEIVDRLDGLPLAIELAAAKVRVMGVADIARRLENRFALLRGGDRSAPDRHQTLLAVIDWSWNLLEDRERRALRWLSVFHDGFTLDAAEAVLGPDALEAVANLADQSLVTVVEDGHGVRYRMLETVREFGRMQLVDAGEDHAAQEAHRTWAIGLCRTEGARLRGAEQFEAIDAVRAEEGNLADVLRRALIAGDPATVVGLLATLGSYWAIRGEHGRVITLIDAVVTVVEGWTAPPELADDARIALIVTLNHGMIAGAERAERLRSQVVALGPDSDDPRIAAQCRVALAFEAADMAGFLTRIEEFCSSPDRHLALLARQMLSHARENAGDPAGGVASAQDALSLVTDEDGPWLRAILHTQISQLLMQAGDAEAAARHAEAALPTLERLGAIDDTLQLRALMVLAAIRAGRLEEAARELTRVVAADVGEAMFGSELVMDLGRAELALAGGDHAQGLAYYRHAVERVRAIQFHGLAPSGLWPWILFGESAALTAHAFYATPSDLSYAEDLRTVATSRLGDVLDPAFTYLDFPVAGLMFYALGSWGLLRGGLSPEDAVRALVIADRFAYNRGVPSMAWENIVPVAEERAPGMLERIGSEYGTRRGPELLDAARSLVKGLGI